MIPSLAMILSTAWLASGSSDLRRVQSVSPTTPAATATTEDPHTCDFYCQCEFICLEEVTSTHFVSP